MSLDLAPFEHALTELDVFLGLCERSSKQAGPKPSEARAFEAAAIQAFEFTYELAHRMLRRFLVATQPSAAEVAALSFPDLIRTGHALGLVRADWALWSRFRELRNITSHTYDPKRAAEVLAAIPTFAREAHDLLARMKPSAA